MNFSKKPLFEISWEVCNKVGGIHTVIASKIFEAQKQFENYFCVGPYLEHSKKVFDEEEIPEEFKDIVEELKNYDIIVHYGTWNIEGFPKALLVEHLGYSCHVNDIKCKLWDLWEIDSLGTHWNDVDEVLLWSWVCGIVIEKFGKKFEAQKLVHAHEWMSGGAIAHIKTLNDMNFRTIFTTHATMLGRTLAGSGGSLEELNNKSAEEIAQDHGIKTKFQIEKALAYNSDCFTTVSDITNEEAKKILGKKADVITYNGFDSCIDDIYTLERLASQSRNSIDGFLMKYFYDFSSYKSFNTRLFYTSGRYELKNKGADIIIKALGKLNQQLKEEGSKQDVIFWFMMMFGDYPLDSKVKESMERAQNEQTPLHLGYAPLSPYELPLDNELIKMLLDEGLMNEENSPVKVIVTPNQFDGKDELLKTPYYRLISGFDLGVFPSSYEPWGYTPAESLAYGVPAVTSDLCGIGKKACEFSCDESFSVIKRKDVDDEQVIDDLVNEFKKNLSYSQKQLSDLKIHSKLCSQNFSWKVFYANYLEAYSFASN